MMELKPKLLANDSFVEILIYNRFRDAGLSIPGPYYPGELTAMYGGVE